MSIREKVKKFFIREKTVYCYAPAPCPKCGALIEVPLTRNPQTAICAMCRSKLFTMAIGLCDLNEEKLRHTWDEVGMWVKMSDVEWNEKQLH